MELRKLRVRLYVTCRLLSVHTVVGVVSLRALLRADCKKIIYDKGVFCLILFYVYQMHAYRCGM